MSETTVKLWLFLIEETSTNYLLSSDYTHGRVSKKVCRRLRDGRFEMPRSIACESQLIDGAT